MKKVLLLSTLMLVSMVLFAFTPVIDGIKDAEWGTTPNHTTTTLSQPIEFNLDGGVYVTDDANFVYIGIPTDNDPWGDGMPVHFHVAIDLRNTAGGGTSDAWGSQVSYGQPYKPDFDIITQWSTTDQNPGWTGFQTWTGTSWSQSQLLPAYIQGGGNKFTEIAIGRSTLGNIEISEIINISVWARPAYNKNRATVCLPAQAGFTADWGDGGASTFTSQFPYTVTTLLADAIAPQVVSAVQLTDSSFNLTFNEPMKEENAIEPSNYTLSGEIVISSIVMVNPSVYTFYTATKLNGGIEYTISAHPEVVDEAGNPIDLAHNSAVFTALYYSNVTFQLNMNLLITNGGFVPATDQVAVRGGINGWGTTNLADLDADGIYTLTLSVPYTTGQSFEYKYWNNHLGGDNWEGIANRSFTIDGVDNIIPVVWWEDIAPTNLTTHPIDVTFLVDMAFVTTLSDVFVAGGFNSWNGSATPMTLSYDSVFSVIVTFPTGTVKNQEYKFINGTEWEFINNRTFVLDDALTEMILPVVYFNDQIPTEMLSVEFMEMNSSLFTNFNNHDLLPAGSNLQFEIRLAPIDINANSNYSATLHFTTGGDMMSRDFVFDNNFEGYSYWHLTLVNGVDVSDGQAVAFYITATDYNGPEYMIDAGGSLWDVTINGGELPAPTNLVISVVGDDIHVTWNPVSGATYYRVYFYVDPYNPSYMLPNDVTVPEIILPGMASFYDRMFFEVRAAN